MTSNILILKRKTRHIPNLLLNWILHFLSNRKQQTRVDDTLPKELEVWGTVPHGTKLGVLLFLLMIDDLVTATHIFKYVDDTTLYTISNNPQNTIFREAVDHVLAWSKENKMKINAYKTKEILVDFNNNPPMYSECTLM